MCSKRDAWPEEAEEDWPENPWQAQANAQVLQLHGGVPVALGLPALLCCGLAVAGPHPHAYLATDLNMPSDMAAATWSVASGPAAAVAAAAAEQHVADLEGQIAALEETLVCKQRELDNATRVPLGNSGTCRRTQSSYQRSAEVSEEIHELSRRNEFMRLLVARFERKTMILEEELASLTLSRREADSRAEAATVTAKHQKELAAEFEGHAALLQEKIIACEAELLHLRDGRGSHPSAAERLAAEERVANENAQAEALGLRDRCAFLEGLVARFEQKTMVLESQLRGLSPLRRQVAASANEVAGLKGASAQAAAEATRAAAEASTALLEAHEATSEHRAAVRAKEVELREWKRRHDRRQQESSCQIKALEKQKRCLEAETKRLQDLCRLPEEPPEVKRLKDLNTQLMERLATERGNSAQTKQALEAALQNSEDLEHRTARLSEQLCELAEVNDDLEEKLVASSLKQQT